MDVDSSGNLWIVDNGNNRVLRFPPGSKTADLVLGQPDFTSRNTGTGLNQLWDPSAVRVNTKGWVYIADHKNNRVLVFKGSLSSGMNGEVFGSGFVGPSGVDFSEASNSGIWITNQGNTTIENWDENSQTKIKTIGMPNNGNLLGDASGSIGFDSSGNMFVAIGIGDYNNDVLMFAKNGPTNSPTKQLFGASGAGNQPDAKGLGTGAGVVAAGNQLIVADGGRILFWNDATSLTNGKAADGYVETSSFTNLKHGCCVFLKADKVGHLYTTTGLSGDIPPKVDIFQLPLTTGAQPIKSINLPLPVLGGGQVTYDNPYQGFTGLEPTDDGKFLWVSMGDQSRVFRLRDPLTNPTVDVVLGQINITNTSCNQGSGYTGGNADTAATNLCYPGWLSLDKQGNLYVSDHSLEIRGNMRLLRFDGSLFPTNNTSIIFDPPASKIFPRLATWEVAFDSQNRMVVGFNPYWTGNSTIMQNGNGFFAGYFNNPLDPSSLVPDGYFKDYYSMAFGADFDDYDNLYVSDLNRGRALIYKNPFNNPTPSSIPSVTPSSLPTPSPSSSPSPLPSAQIGSVIKIYAAGEPANNVYPNMRLQIFTNGRWRDVATYNSVKGDFQNRVFQEFSYTTPFKILPENVRVRYLNELRNLSRGIDRNLLVDKITIDGVEYQSEAPTVYSTGSWNANNQCRDGYQKSEWLKCEGYFQYKK